MIIRCPCGKKVTIDPDHHPRQKYCDKKCKALFGYRRRRKKELTRIFHEMLGVLPITFPSDLKEKCLEDFTSGAYSGQVIQDMALLYIYCHAKQDASIRLPLSTIRQFMKNKINLTFLESIQREITSKECLLPAYLINLARSYMQQDETLDDYQELVNKFIKKSDQLMIGAAYPVKIAAILYYVLKERLGFETVTQKQIGGHFNVSEISIRNRIFDYHDDLEKIWARMNLEHADSSV